VSLASGRHGRPQPYAVQVLRDLHKNGQLPEVTDLWVEPSFGAVAQAHYADGGCRIVRINDLGVNSSAAVALVKDKGHTRQALERLGYSHPRGMTVLMPWWAQRMGSDLSPDGPDAWQLPAAAVEFVSLELGFPVYVKSAHGSLGRSVWRCDTEAEMLAAFEQCQRKRVRVAVVEQAVELPDYRLFVIGGEVPIAYERVPLHVVGDGERTIAELCAQVHTTAADRGRFITVDVDDQRIAQRLARAGLTLHSTPPDGEVVRLLDVFNLSTGGMLRDVSDELGAGWADLAVQISADFGLACCGVDLACADITGPLGEYFVLELNGTPGLDHYAAASVPGDARARGVLASVFAASPGAAHERPPRICR